jgi:hypothetical protein
MNTGGYGIDPRFFLWSGILVYVGFDGWHGYLIHDPVRIAFFGWVIFLMLGTILHELGHAVTAKTLGSEVFRIKLGLKQNPTGPHWSFRFLGFPWEVYSFPLSGTVWAFTTNPHRYRTRCVAISAAGPATSLFLASAGGLALLWPAGLVAHGLLWGWVAANTFLFLATAIPIKITYGGKPGINDGINIIRHLSLTDNGVRERCLTAAFELAVFRAQSTANDISLAEAVARHETARDDIGLLVLTAFKAIEEKSPVQYPILLELARHPATPKKKLATILDSHLTSVLGEGRAVPAGYLDEASALLVRAADNSLTARGTRGSVLVELGRFEEGRCLLEAVVGESKNKTDQAYAHIFLALAAKGEGNPSLAQEQARQAAVADPDCPALGRVRNIMAIPTPAQAD